MTNVQYVNLSLQIWGCILSLIVIICIKINEKTKNKIKSAYIILLLSNMGVMLFDALALIFRGKEGVFAYFGVRATNFLAFCSAVILTTAFLNYMILCIDRQGKEPVTPIPLRISIGLCCVYAGLYVVNLFVPIIYKITEDNIYERTSLYPIAFLPTVINVIFALYLLKRYKNDMDKNYRRSFYLYVILPVIVTPIQIMIYGLNLVNFASMILIVLIFLFIQEEQSRKLAEQEKKLLEDKIEIMMSQIRPHFLYNALNSIHYLCEEDGKTAAEAIQHFSLYLRENMDSLEKKDLVSIREEINHVRNYLYIEQLRFPEIKVVYEVNSNDFKIPPLTLQTIVENAIKHGYNMKHLEGTITIRTYEDNDAYYLEVQDDGVGFDVNEKKGDDKTHIGIENTRKRIEVMCNGTYQIKSKAGKGTIVTIAIPR